MAGENTFTIGLFQIGDTKSCLYSWCCYPCAIAEARSYMDGSPFCFNLSLTTCAVKWLMRSTYQIGDTTDYCVEDCIIPACCTCCVANQLYQTGYTKGKIVADGGFEFNNGQNGVASAPTCACSGSCCYAFFCTPCFVGQRLEDSIGMPCLFGCCCVGTQLTSIFMTKNLIRYHYRLKDNWECNESCAECGFPLCVGSISYILAFTALGILAWIPYISWALGVANSLNNDVMAKQGQGGPGYMIGYTPSKFSGQGFQMVAPGPGAIIVQPAPLVIPAPAPVVVAGTVVNAK